jgi:hypothetical protein
MNDDLDIFFIEMFCSNEKINNIHISHYIWSKLIKFDDKKNQYQIPFSNSQIKVSIFIIKQ